MPKTNAISIFENPQTQAKLNEVQAGIVENLQKTGNSFKVKSTNANLSEKAGSYIFKRFQNSQAKPYGTARSNQAGDKLTAPDITVNVDDHKEIVEEVAKFDAERFGVDASVLSVVNARKQNHQMTLKRDCETKFWEEAYRGAVCGDDLGLRGQVVAGIGAAGNTPVDEYLDVTNFVALETVKNNYVNGVSRDLMLCLLSPKAYSKMKSRLNTMYNANFSIADEELQGINGVVVLNELYLPKKVESITLVKESVAQPLSVDEYDASRIPLSKDIAIELFYDKGTKALAGDLIVIGIETDATHTKVEFVDALPASAADTAVDTIYVLKAPSASYNAANAISDTNFPAGTMFTATKASSTVTWTQYNV